MKKLINIILSIIIGMLCFIGIVGCRCAPTKYWEMQQDKQNVKEIYLVEYTDNSYTLIKSIDLEIIDTLCEDISALVMTKHTARGLPAEGKGFIFEYENGELDIVCINNSGEGYFDKNGRMRLNGYGYHFNDMDYENLINKYLNM